MMTRRLSILFVSLLMIGCGARTSYIAGTEIPKTDANEAIVERVEEYRQAVEEQDSSALLLMASKDYWEDSGTPTGEDDYGFEGLKDLLKERFGRAESIRYAMRYMRIRYLDNGVDTRKAFVDVLVDASFTVPDSRGELRRADKRDQNQLVLEWDGDKWMFLSGM